MTARELLSKPGAWTQNAVARNSKGEPCNERDPDAQCWSVYGACCKTQGSDSIHGSKVARAMAWAHSQGLPGIGTWNNMPHRTQADAVALLEELGL